MRRLLLLVACLVALVSLTGAQPAQAQVSDDPVTQAPTPPTPARQAPSPSPGPGLAPSGAPHAAAPLRLHAPQVLYPTADPAQTPAELGAGWLIVAESLTPAEPLGGDAGRLLDNMLRAMQLHRHPRVHLAALERAAPSPAPAPEPASGPTDDIPAALEISDRIAILYNRKIHVIDTVENIKKSDDPVVKAFIEGSVEG